LSHGAATRGSEQLFEHDAFLYAGEEQFLHGVLPFIQAGIEAGDPVVAALDRAKIALLEAALGGDARHVQFADMREIGANPARLIPAWQHWLDARSAPRRRVWGIGEPVWAGRSAAELVECHRHEALLNFAFAGEAPLSLLCPYDTVALDAEVIAGAHSSHPNVVDAGSRRASHAYCGLEALTAPFAEPLPEPRAPVHELTFAPADLADLRTFVAGRARSAGLGETRVEDLVLALNEVATNSVRHGGGRGVLRIWVDADMLVCEVRDHGRIAQQPLVGRVRPALGQAGGWGLWLANQLIDIVQLRELPDGSVVRLHQRTR
jgi:anti-sigma regulatory factor (Ser/Thr protein kinase)